MDILRRFLESGRTGFYFAVTTEGEAGAAPHDLGAHSRDRNFKRISGSSRVIFSALSGA